ncbi:MAG: peptidase S9 [Gemmatimonas sp. SM23_52]|nr:MAG: peptidase S9 [Gemmatimonas sp. SM23_52]
MRHARISLALLLLFTVAAPLGAQQQDRSLLTLERIFASPEFRGAYFGPTRWLTDGSGYTTLERAAGLRALELVRYDLGSGAREVLVRATRLIPAGESSPLFIAGYDWSEDGRKLLIFTNPQRVWRYPTRGDYWVLDLATWKLRQLGVDLEPASLMFAKFSPDGTRVAYVSEHNIYVEDLGSGRITPLTTDGTEKLINGTSDWVYEEEFDLRDGFRWSPNGEHVAYWQFDSEGLGEFILIDNTDSIYPKLTRIPYPKAGTTNSAVRVGVVSAAAGATRWFRIEGDPRDSYIPRMEWAGNSDQVIIQHMNRGQNTTRVLLGDVRTGAVRTVLTETDEAWVDVVNDIRWLDGGQAFTWVSERDGWRHHYKVSRGGGKLELITPGEFDVDTVLHIDEGDGWIYYIASPDNATQRYLYRGRLDGRGRPQRLTPADQPGTHRYDVSPDGRWAFHTYSRIDQPNRIELVRLPGHERVRTLVDNAALRASLDALKRGPVEFFRVDVGDGVVLDGWQMKPPDLDATKRYPVLLYVYGGPWDSTVRDVWMGPRYLWHLLLSQQGYIVMSVDNRGTPVPRGREWRKVIYGKTDALAAADQAAAVRVIREWSYVDPDRIGSWGWSNGGNMSLHAVFHYPELYSTALAVAPLTDWRFYDTIYTERYMGLPSENAEGYEAASAITYADGLKGNLLIVHGTGDDNVHYQGTEALMNALIAAGRQFTVMPYPGRSHGIFEGRGTTLHVYTLLTSYLNEHMPPGPRTEAAR